MTDDIDNLTYTQRLKAAVHYTVCQICEEVAEETGVTFSRQFKAVLAEATYKQSQRFAVDLELFAKHAKRQIVGPDDVKLLVRKSPGLLEHITQVIEAQITSKSGPKNRRKKSSKQGNVTAEEDNSNQM